MITEQPQLAEQQKVDEPQNGSGFKRLLVPIMLAVGFIAGTAVGKRLGASYQGFGHISGARVGEWLGFAIGVSVAATVAGLVLTSGTGNRVRRMVSCFAVVFLFVLSSVVAIIAEANTGELGGPLAFIAFWAVAGTGIYMAGKRSRIVG